MEKIGLDNWYYYNIFIQNLNIDNVAYSLNPGIHPIKMSLNRMFYDTRLAILSVFLIVCFCSCNHTEGGRITQVAKDSLLARCEQYVSEFQVDSLRSASRLYMQSVEPYSREYFKGYRLYVNADFNEKNYDEVLLKLEKGALMPHFKDYPDIGCSYQYTRGRALQYSKRYEQAQEAFKGCLAFDSNNADERESIRRTILEALLQLMNTYQTAADPEGCVAYFKALQQHPTPIVRDYCERDLCMLLGYALSRTDQMQEAEEMIEKGLGLPLYHSTPERLFRDYSYAAATFFTNAQKQSQVIEWCEQALEAADSYKYTPGVQWATNLLGSLYKRTGKMQEAVALYQKSVRIAVEKKDLAAESNAYNSLVDLYLHYDFREYANEYSNLSIQRVLAQGDRNPTVVGYAYLMKGQVMRRMERRDSALYFWQKADSCYRPLPYTSGLMNLDKQIGSLLVDHCMGDSLQRGIDRLERIIAKSTLKDNLGPVYLQLAKGYLKQHKTARAEAMLGLMYKCLNASESPLFLDDAYRFGLEYYLDKGDSANIERYARAYLKEANFYFNAQVSKKVTEAIVSHQAEMKKKELLLIQGELANKELRVKLDAVFSVSLLVLLLVSCVLFGYKRKLYRVKQQLAQEHLSHMLENLQKANQRSQEMEVQLKELFTDKESAQQIASLTPELFRESGEAKFRHRFSQLYPSFLPTLKENVPTIGKSEEILCMLIILDQTAEQITDILCIARSSVNMARHRLRQKMQLEKGDSLEDAIKGYLKR